MTKKEAKAFFDKVKGRKINRSDFGKNDYFIPQELHLDKKPYSISGYDYSYSLNKSFYETYYVNEGFNEVSFGIKWYYVIDIEYEISML